MASVTRRSTRNRVPRPRWLLCLGAVGAAAALAWWPSTAADVEHFYGRGLFPPLQRALTWLTNTMPIAWLDLLVVALVVWVVWNVGRVVRASREARRSAVARLCCHVCVMVCAGYVLFLALWGMNYRREPLAVRLGFDRSRVTEAAITTFAEQAVATLNGLADRARDDTRRGDGWAAVAERLRTPFAETLRALRRPDARPARPKVPWLSVYFDAAGVSGMTNPYGLETLVAGNLLPVERPMIVAHEWAHLAGIGAESEASFVGFLVCTQGDPAARYSGWLDVTIRALRVLPDPERRRLLARLERAVIDDIEAIAARNARDQVVWLSGAAWNIYDRYLKANRVTEGVRSYDGVVALIVGTDAGRGAWGGSEVHGSGVQGVRGSNR